MLADAETSDFQYIIIYKMDRFTRNRNKSWLFNTKYTGDDGLKSIEIWNANANNGVSIKLTSERLGHSSTSTTMDTYWHIIQNEQDKLLNILESAKNDKK